MRSDGPPASCVLVDASDHSLAVIGHEVAIEREGRRALLIKPPSVDAFNHSRTVSRRL